METYTRNTLVRTLLVEDWPHTMAARQRRTFLDARRLMSFVSSTASGARRALGIDRTALNQALSYLRAAGLITTVNGRLRRASAADAA